MEKEIRKYAHLMKELGLTALEINSDDRRVRLERNETVCASVSSSISTPLVEEKSYTPIYSSLVGVFYQAPQEDAKPYVSLGDRVSKGQTLCIIEAMKLMNEIQAEEDGIISKICVSNGQVVEYGTELFQITRA